MRSPITWFLRRPAWKMPRFQHRGNSILTCHSLLYEEYALSDGGNILWSNLIPSLNSHLLHSTHLFPQARCLHPLRYSPTLQIMLLLYLLIPLSLSYIATSYTETCTGGCTTATLLDFFGYGLYNASVIAANPTATTYLLACIPQYSGDCNNDGTTVNLTAINGPSTAGLIATDTRKSASWEYHCPVTDFKISSCIYMDSSIVPSGSVISGEFHSSGAFSTFTGPTVLSDSTVLSDGFTEITNVVLLVTGGVEKLATLTEPASTLPTTSEVGSCGSSNVTTEGM